jgi:hypothetical protein
VKLLQQAIADGANLIKPRGDAGLGNITKYAWGQQASPQLLHLDVGHRAWRGALRQLVVYCCANDLVPPDSRR